jgi:hypothetical protein
MDGHVMVVEEAKLQGKRKVCTEQHVEESRVRCITAGTRSALCSNVRNARDQSKYSRSTAKEC